MLDLHAAHPRIVLVEDHDDYPDIRARLGESDLSIALIRNPWAWYVGTYLAWRPVALETMRKSGQEESIVPNFNRFIRETILLTRLMAENDIALNPGEERKDILPLAWWEGVQRRLEIGRQSSQFLRATSDDAARFSIRVDCILDVDAIRGPGGDALLDEVFSRAGLDVGSPELLMGLRGKMMLQAPGLPADWADYYDDDPQLAELVEYNERYLVGRFGYTRENLLGEETMTYVQRALSLVS